MDLDGNVDDPRSSVQQIMIHDYLTLLGFIILFYDHFLTFGDEVTYLWKRHISMSSIWFFLNRYIAFFGDVAVAYLTFASLSKSGCHKFSIFRQALLVVNELIVCAILSIRIYALYGRNRRILYIIVTSWVVLVGLTAYSLLGQKSVAKDQQLGCHVGLTHDNAIRQSFAWLALFVYDCILFAAIVFKAIRIRDQPRVSIAGSGVSIRYILLRDGFLYFAVMALANLGNIITFHTAGPFLRAALSTFAGSMSVTMMSRLIINLHKSAHSDGALSENTRLGPLAFHHTAASNNNLLGPRRNLSTSDTYWSGFDNSRDVFFKP